MGEKGAVSTLYDAPAPLYWDKVPLVRFMVHQHLSQADLRRVITWRASAKIVQKFKYLVDNDDLFKLLSFELARSEVYKLA